MTSNLLSVLLPTHAALASMKTADQINLPQLGKADSSVQSHRGGDVSSPRSSPSESQGKTDPLRARIYLAARYSRRQELCAYRQELRQLGFDVQARWLDGHHEFPKGPNETAHFSQEDFDDVTSADIIINFTELPRSTNGRGGRHVELGIGLALHRRVIVVGHRENVFHYLPQIEFAPTWADAVELIHIPF